MHQLYGREVSMNDGSGLTADASGRGTKRPVPDDECMEEVSVGVCKRVRDEGQRPEPDTKEEKRAATDEEHDFNLPLPWEEGLPCLVKVATLNFSHLNVHLRYSNVGITYTYTYMYYVYICTLTCTRSISGI